MKSTLSLRWMIPIIGICIALWMNMNCSAFIPAFNVSENHNSPVVILDAGHGGEDGGASTPSGAKESEINLSVVKKLHLLLAFCGTQAILTRGEDISLHSDGCVSLHDKKVSDLKNRADMINGHDHALLLSVHQNYFTDPRYHGAQVFYSDGEISRQWGLHTQEILKRILDRENSRKAVLLSDSVYLFRQVHCPSILVECGFLSNGEEASLLLTDSYQRKIALALAGACLWQLNALQALGGSN